MSFDGVCGTGIAKDQLFYNQLLKRKLDMMGTEIEYKVPGQDIIDRLNQRAEKALGIANALVVDGNPPTSACDRGIYEMARKEVELSRLRAKYLQAGEVYTLSGGILADIFIEQERYGQYAITERGPGEATSQATW